MKNLRDVGITVLALGTAYGLGIISCVVYEIKLFADVCDATKKDNRHNRQRD